MAVYNAWCDRAPILCLGATGPWDATRRRPWIDWIHTSADQGGLIRNFTKWDNQPGSPAAAMEAIMRASQIAQTAPRGPVYVNLEVSMQEDRIDAMPPHPGRRALPFAAAGRTRARARGGSSPAAVHRETPGDPRWPLLAQRRGMEGAHRAR